MAFEPNTDILDAGEPEDANDDASKPDERSDEEIIADARARYEISRDVWDYNHREGLDDLKFARLEEQWPEAIKRQRDMDGRPSLTLNQLHTFIFQVVNSARQNKPGITVHPVDSKADPEVADIFNGLIRHIEQSSDADVAYDTAMDFAVSCGFGYWRVNTRYTCDDTFEQDLAIERIANPFSVFPDPNSTAADSSDWNECILIDEIPVSAFKKRWKDKEPTSFDAEAYERREVSDEDMVLVAEAWTREQVPRTITTISAADPQAAAANPAMHDIVTQLMPDSMIVGLDVYKDNQEVFDILGMKPVGKTREVMTYKVTQRILSGSDVLETVDWAGEFIPIVPVWGEELTVEGRRVLRSLIRGAKDAQRMVNYHHSTATEVVALQPKTPFIGKTGSFDTDAAKWATSNTQSHAYIEFDGNDAPERVALAGVPTGALQLANTAQQQIMSIVGIYKSSIGAQSNETSGVAINTRDKQADTGSFHFTDNLSRAIRHCGRILLDLIPKVYNTPRILRILGSDGQPTIVAVNQPTQVPQMGPNGQQVSGPVMGPNGQPQVDPQSGAVMQELKTIAKVYDLTVGKYDLVVKAGPSFATQREEIVEMLTEIIRVFPASAPVLADVMFRNYDMPGADEIAERLTALLPAAVKGQDPQLQQAHEIIQAGTKKLQDLQTDLDSANLMVERLKADKSYDAGKLGIDAYKAQTDRIEALAPQGMPQTPEELQAVVMASVRSILANPGDLGTASGAASADLATALPPPNNAPQSQGLPPANNNADAPAPLPAMAITPR